MTPDKRLDQIEPVLADVAQKTDRLIESNGLILQLTLDNQAQIQKVVQQSDSTARGLANLTVNVNQRFDQIDQRFDRSDQRFDQADKRFDQQQNQINNFQSEMSAGFQQLDLKIDRIDEKIDTKVDGLQQEIKALKDTQTEILTILRERLK